MSSPQTDQAQAAGEGITMDYNPPLCTACHYRLPMTWTNKTEMLKMLTAAGWKLDPAICPECRRKKWLAANKWKASAPTVDSRS